MSNFLNLWNITGRIRRFRTQQIQLNRYYPKGVYDPLARREMKTILTNFNDVFYGAYPEMLSNPSQMVIDYHPRSHSKQYEVQRAIKLCKAQKVRRKDLVKIEEYLNLQYMIEEQLGYYHDKFQKAVATKELIDQEAFSSFFPELFDARMKKIKQKETYSLNKIQKLEKEKQMCEKAIHDLMNSHPSFWGDATKMIGGMVVESVRQVAEMVDQSFRKK